MIKLTAICFGCSLMFSAFFLQLVPPVVKPPIISDTLWSTIITVAGLIIVAWLNKRDNQKTKEEVKKEVVSVKSEVTKVETKVDNSQAEIKTLVENTDGKITELLDVNKQLSEKIGIEKGIEISKAAHDEQSAKDEASNIAKGKIEGLKEAETKQTTLTPGTEPTEVKIVNKEDDPAEVAVNEKKDKDPDK